MADIKVPDAPVSSSQNLAGELDTMGKQIETLAEDSLKKETSEQLKGLRAAIADPTADPQYLRMQIDHLRSGIDAAKKIQQGKEQIRDVLSELSPERIESSVQLMEALINIYPEGEGKALLRGYAGSFMLEQFEKNNHRIVIGADNTISLSLIDESKKTPEITQNSLNLEKKINTLIGSKKMDINTLRTGMLYRAPSFISYSDTLRDAKGQVPDTVKNRDPKAYFEYLSEKKKNGYVLSEAEKTLVQSEAGFTGFNAMIPAISEAKDLSKMEQVAIVVMKKYEKSQSSQPDNHSQQSGSRAPSVVGEGIGTIGAGIGKIAGAGAKGGIGMIADVFNSAVKEGGAWGGLAVLGGLIAAVWKLGFWKTLGGIFGIGVVSEAAAGRIDLDKETAKLKAAGTAVGAAADKAATAVSGQEAGAVKPEEKPKLTPSQEKANGKVMGDMDFVLAIKEQAETNAKSKNGETKKKTGKAEDYLNFINSQAFQDQKLDNLLYVENIDSSVFSNNSTFALKGIDIPENLDRSYLKRVLRLYIIGQYKLSTPAGGAKLGQKEKEDFLKDKQKEKYKDKRLADLIGELNQ